MSGGSMDYICYRIADYASDLCDKEMTELATDMADIFHDAEWWHSSDTCEETYRESVAKFKAKWFGTSRQDRLIGYINETLAKAKSECYALVSEPLPEPQKDATT